MGRWAGALLLVWASAGLWGCADPTKVTAEWPFMQTVSVRADELMLPSELGDDPTNPTSVVEVPCGPSVQCPSSMDVTITCNSQGLCDPEPVRVSEQFGTELNLDSIRSSLDFAEIDSFHVESVEYAVTSNTLTMDVPEVTILWSSVGAVEGQVVVGTLPAIAAGQTPSGSVVINEGGVAALSDHLLEQESRARFFWETDLDVDPGDPWPSGSIQMDITVRIVVTGSLI